MWQSQYLHGKWILGVSAGGRGEHNEAKYWTNPQLSFHIHSNDVIQDNKCWVIIALMQKYTRNKRVKLRVDTAEEYIQFRLYKAKDTDLFLLNLSQGEQFETSNLDRIGSSGSYINKREVTARFSLTPGAYLIVPSCYDEDVEGEFLVRIFTEKPLSHK